MEFEKSEYMRWGVIYICIYTYISYLEKIALMASVFLVAIKALLNFLSIFCMQRTQPEQLGVFIFMYTYICICIKPSL